MTPTEKLTEQIKGIRERHSEHRAVEGSTCNWCEGYEGWPCDAIQLAQKLEEAVKALAEVGHSIRTEVNLRYAEPVVGANATRFIGEALSRIAEMGAKKAEDYDANS